jgi:hypothetical protein
VVISEVSKLFAVLAAAYPRFDVDDIKLKLWYEMLKDIPYMVAQTMVKKYICENPYPPTISDIREAVAEVARSKEGELDAGGSWGEVMRCIRNYGIYNPEEALSNMSRRTAEVVKRIGWREICQSESLSVIRGQFIKIYESLEKRERKSMILPESIRKEIEGFGEWFGRLYLVEGESEEKM